MKISSMKLSLYIIITLICVSVLAFSFINVNNNEAAKAYITYYDGPVTFDSIADAPSGYELDNYIEEQYTTGTTTVGTKTITKAYLYKKNTVALASIYSTNTKHTQGATTNVKIGKRKPNLTDYINSIGIYNVDNGSVIGAAKASELCLLTVYTEMIYYSESGQGTYVINASTPNCYAKRDAMVNVVDYRLIVFRESRTVSKNKNNYTVIYDHSREDLMFLGFDYDSFYTNDYTTTSI